MNRKERRKFQADARRKGRTSGNDFPGNPPGFRTGGFGAATNTNLVLQYDPEMMKPIEIGLAGKLNFIDQLIAMGEETYEIESEVNSVAHELSVIFFGWISHRGVEDGAEVIASMVRHFVQFTYLGFEERRPTIGTITKKQLMEFINHLEFAVSQEQWDGKINPFDGLSMFFEFLERIGYPVKRETRQRALVQIRRTVLKSPVHESMVKGVELTQ